MISWQKSEKEFRKIEAARAICALEETEGWRYFLAAAEKLIENNIPDINTFDTQEAVRISAQLAFASGVRRCLGLVAQHKNMLKHFSEKS